MDESTENALRKIIRSVNISEQSTLHMREKLSNAGYSNETINAAIQNAIDRGILDDRRYAEMLVRCALSSGKGLCFAEREIEELGIDPTSLESYQAYLAEGDEYDFYRAIDVLRAHPPHAKDRYASAVRKLVGKGYSPSIATSAARTFCENDNTL